ncbi:hypothetical protein OQJ26_06275 [Legionella sp. PATHC038]|uniref:hypothetical protein n=1 Tax=Legionella sheltonii TaxID=2992041 RepID=UPI002243915C|nr:hypothetical protein [Legionella sp. PATHC038]MCW8398395.1 hypothetical protein [Legionella sp. PATHC038]
MKITVGEDSFDNVKDFTTHLEVTYEQDKLISGEVTVALECDAFSQKHFDELLAFLLSPERFRIYKFEFPSQQSRYQLAFDNAYLLSKRQKFSLEFQQQIIELAQSPIQPHTPKIRKAKKNWVEGTNNSSIGLQLQYQIPHEHQHQQQKATPRKRKNNEAPYQHPEISPLSLVPEIPHENVLPVVGSYQQFIYLKKDSESIERYKAEFDALLSETSSSEQRQAAFIFFVSKLAENDAPKLKRIKGLLEVLPLTDLNYQGLAHVFIHSGAGGVLLLLQQIKTLHEKEFFKDFDALFLDKPEHYLALMSPQGLANLKKLSELSSEQKTWWLTLVAQHKATGVPTDFNDLFEAYNYFLEELEKKKLKLPFSCTLKNIKHMKSALDCLLFIINNSSEPEEQLRYLDGLDVHSAYYASRDSNYQLVSRHMNLRADVDEEIPDYSTPAMPKEVSEWLTPVDCSYEEFITRFYRFIGTQEWAFSMDVYQKMEREISKNNNLSNQNKALLLNVVILLTTGQRTVIHTEYPDTSIKKLVDKLIATAEQFDEDLQQELSTVISGLAKSLALQSWESMPTADELDSLVDVLVLMQKTKAQAPDQARDEFQEVSSLALSFSADFGDAARLVLEHYKRRLVMEQTNTVPIQKFSYTNLLNHLISPSKLARFLPELFQEQPETLSRMVVLFSLLDDEIAKVTQQDAEDSEFETKIKTLAYAVHAMQDDRREQLLSILTDINIEASYRLPSLDQLIKTVDSVRKAELTEVEDQKASILEMVHTELPGLKIGKEPVNETEMDFFSLMRQNYEQWQLEKELTTLPEKIKGYLEPWMDAHNIVLYYLNQQPVSPPTVLNALAEEEQEVKKLLSSRMFSWTLSGFPQATITMTDVLGDEFFSEQSFLSVLQPRIKASLQSSLSAALKSLQTSNWGLEDFLLTHIEELDTDLPIDERFLEWMQRLEDANGLINSLTRIKNKSSIDFRRCISVLADEIKPKVPGKKALTLVQIQTLLDTLSQDEPLSVASPLAIICRILKDAPGYSGRQLHQVLCEVNYLTKYRGILGAEAYESLLRWSFTYNLTQNSLFPLKKLIDLKSLAGVDEKHSKDLFNALIEVIKNAGPEVDEQLIKTMVEKITSITQAKARVPALVPMLTLLMKTCTNGKEQTFLNLVDKLNDMDDSDLNIFSKILLTFGERATDKNVHRLLEVQAELELKQYNLKKLAKLFDSPPYPEIDGFIHALNGYDNELMAYIDALDKDPKSARAPKKNEFGMIIKDTEQILDEQFESSQIMRVIGNIQDSVEGTSLSSQEQYDLAQQITYINAVGRSKPFTLVVGDDPSTQTILVYENLTQVSRDELRDFFNILIDTIRRPGLDAQEKLKAQVKLLAVLREQYFRATGVFADTTQLISVLFSLKGQQNNMLMEVETEEAYVSATLLAVMQWVEAEGGTIDVCTANRDMVIHDDRGTQDFLTSLGIASGRIRADSPKGTYQVGGINYSTVGDLALYRSRAKVDNEHLIAYKDGHPVSSNLILCGSDFSKLNQKTIYHLVQADENHSYTWIYPLVHAFIHQQKFTTPSQGTVWSEGLDVERLKEFLDQHTPTGQHKVQLSSIPDEQFSLWVNSAIEAQRLVEGEDFDILPSDTALHSAIPLSQKESQEGFTYLIHQFLHVRLQQENPDWEFTIQPEMRFVDSSSTKDLIDDYKKQGRIIALSKSVSKKDELAEQCSQFSINDQFVISSQPKNQHQESAKKSKEGAVERHYTQKVSEIQHVVLQQFQEWKEFLHLVYPKSEWRTLDVVLFKQREDLILDLNKKWIDCLEHTDPQKKYPNPYVRSDVKQHLQRMILDDAVLAYEGAVSLIWEQKRAFLKGKATPVLIEGSVNDLRCQYLDGVSLPEQLKLSRIAVRENKKAMLVEKKKAHRYFLSGLDVNGAMLRFADGNVDSYRNDFVKNQVALFAADIKRIIENNPYLNKKVRSILLAQVAQTQTFDNLIVCLRDYANKYLPEEQFTEKYAVQPIIHEMLRLFNEADLEEPEELQNLKTIYLDNVVVELVDELETTLSWAKKENRGLGYLLERSTVAAAAEAILDAVQQLKEANDLDGKKIAIKNLYKVLAQQELQIEGLWIFPFWGHKNTRTLIKNTLATLNGLTAIGSGENELDANFIHHSKEEALSDVMKEQLNTTLDALEYEDSSLGGKNEWKGIKRTLAAMQTENNTIYAFYEMYYFLSNKVAELAEKHSPLQKPVAHLRGKVRSLFEKFSQEHRELLSKSKYLTSKAEHLRGKLTGLNGFKVDHVTLKKGHNGFIDYFDLVIEGSGAHALFHDFTQYNSRAGELTKKRDALEVKLIQANVQSTILQQLIKEQLPLLKFKGKNTANAELFPKQFQDQVNDILVLKGWVVDQSPEDLSSFPDNIRHSFIDRDLVKTFEFPELNEKEIDKIQDIVLKIGFKDLRDRMVEGMKNKSLVSKIYSYASSYVFTPETMEDWLIEFNYLVNKPTVNLENFFRPNIQKKQSELASQLEQLQQKTADQVESLNQQIIFLNEKIKEEERKGSVYIKRMTHASELFEFEKQLKTFKAEQAVNLPRQENPIPVVLQELHHSTPEIRGLNI